MDLPAHAPAPTPPNTRNNPGVTGAPGGSLSAVPVPVPVPHAPPDLDLSTGASPGGNGPVLAGGPSVPPLLGTGSPVPAGTVLPGGIAPGGGIAGGLVIGGSGVWDTSAGLRGVGGSGWRAAGGRQPVPVRQALPSGATIGADMSQGGLGVSRGAGQQPMAGRGDRKSGPGHGRDSVEADLQWEASEGVPPVIGVDTNVATHDPGPGVIGHHR
jgi:hypothetical protein